MSFEERFICFQSIDCGSHTYQSDWYPSWREGFDLNTTALSEQHGQALARLIPVLLCGEQSANLVFSAEVQRLATTHNSSHIESLKRIEADEYFHDLALQGVLGALRPARDLNKIRRRAQVFYAGLGKCDSLTDHFAQICHLDTCVTIIMSEMALSHPGKNHIVGQLFEHIRQDEARHVRICSDHLRYLGANPKDFKAQAQKVRAQLVSLLKTEITAFEQLGVDCDRMFIRMLK